MRFVLLLATLLWSLNTAGQFRKKSVKRPEPIVQSGYRDLVVIHNTLWALGVDDSLRSFSSNGEEQSSKLALKPRITSIHYAGNDSLLLLTGSDILLLNTRTLVHRQQGKLPNKAKFLARDDQGTIWAATEQALLNVNTKQQFAPDSSLNYYYKWLPEPSASLLDRAGILWIGFAKGEWGGNLHAFNTKNKRFVPLSFTDSLACLQPVKAFCQVRSHIYMSGGVMHFSTSGCITRFEGFQAKHVFNSSWENNFRTSVYGEPSGEYIGPIAYSEAEQKVYYYSQNGVFRADPTQDLSRMEAWQLVFTPRLRWRSGQSDAIGSPMNVRKMVFTADNKLVLLTQNDGIGIWDGHVFKLIP